MGYTKEEIKLVNETKKIFHETIKITATAVRVPIKNCHSEAINVEFERHFDMGQVIEILEITDNIKVKLLEREQFWIDNLKPQYNILLVAGSNLGYQHTEKTK